MKIELKQIIDQLSEAINLDNGYKVCAMIDSDKDNEIVGWNIVKVLDDGTIIPQNDYKFKNIKELITTYIKNKYN